MHVKKFIFEDRGYQNPFTVEMTKPAASRSFKLVPDAHGIRQLIETTPKTNTKKHKTKNTLREEDFIDEDYIDVETVEDSNELVEEAAKYELFFKDARYYDYMQHLKPIGVNPGAVFIEAPHARTKSEKKGEEITFLTTQEGQNDEDKACPESTINDDQDLDPAVREVLEALEDDRYLLEEIQEEDEEDIRNLNALRLSDDDEDMEDEMFVDYESEVDVVGESSSASETSPSSYLDELEDGKRLTKRKLPWAKP